MASGLEVELDSLGETKDLDDAIAMAAGLGYKPGRLAAVEGRADDPSILLVPFNVSGKDSSSYRIVSIIKAGALRYLIEGYTQ